jgi:flagellar export protein FliJ
VRSFRFRAQAALQLRQREHDRALATLARAHTALTAAQQRLAEADHALAEGDDRLRDLTRTPAAHDLLGWYRSWRLRMHVDRQACEAVCREREADVECATSLVNDTRRQVRALERLHDKLLAAWRRESLRAEQKATDALAAVRFTRREERTHSD